MKRYFKASLGFVMLAVVSLTVACKTEKKGCTGCCEEPGVTKVLTIPGTDEKITLQFYNVITPVNDEYCDYYLADLQKVEGSCRPNYDTVFNSTDVYNDYFEIGGYNPALFREKGLRSYLRIQTETDTTQIWPSKRSKYSYGEQGILFRGESEIIPTTDGKGVIKPFASGRYKYKFLIYDSVASSKDSILVHTEDYFADMTSEDSINLMIDDPDLYLIYIDAYSKTEYQYSFGDSKKERLIDSVVGVFCIIRNDSDCQISTCVGKDPGDNLLK